MSSQHVNDRPVSTEEREATKSAIEAEEQHLAELQHSIAEHEAVINSLKHTSMEVKTRIASHQALISGCKIIPDELLGHIFTMVDYQPYCGFPQRVREEHDAEWATSIVTPERWRCRSPMNVCHVSRRWRQVAMSTPQVWCDLVIDLKKKHPVDMMELWFKLAKAVPVHVTLWCEGNPYLIPMLGFNTTGLCADCIMKHLFQVGSLHLVVEDESRGEENVDFSRFCKAMSCVDGTSASRLLPPFPLEILGNIDTLDIKGFFVSDAFLAYAPASLTVLNLDAPTQSDRTARYANTLTALLNLPNLRKLRLCGQYPAVYDPNNGDQSPSSRLQIVQMAHLTRLTLTCATYVRFLCAPVLQHLEIKERGSSSYGPYETGRAWTGIGPLVSSFLARSRPPLVRFSAIDIEVDLKEEELVGWLGQMNTVECLVVSLSPVLVDAVTSALVLKREDGDGESFGYCPNLKVFKCRWWGQPRQAKGKKARSLVGRDDVVVCGRMKYDAKWTRCYGAGGEIGKYWE